MGKLCHLRRSQGGGNPDSGGAFMTFDDVLDQVLALLQREGRVSYRALKLRFDINDDYVEGIKDELIYAKKLAVDEDNRVLVWVGEQESVSTPPPVPATPDTAASPALDHAREPLSYTPTHLVEKILTSRSALEGERKQVTVLFADVQGSMDLAESVDAEEWHHILDRFFAILSDGIHRFEGTINQFTGDGVMALFGAPIAHEDHAHRACHAALALGAELARYSTELRRTRGLGFSVRMGLNSGEVVVGKIGDDLRMDYTAQGRTVGLAARVEQLAAPDRVYLTQATAALVAGYLRLKELGEFSIKG